MQNLTNFADTANYKTLSASGRADDKYPVLNITDAIIEAYFLRP